MVTREDMQKRLLATFREEAAEHLQVLTSEVDSLVADPDGSAAGKHLATLFRIMHTLKGAARSVRSTEIENICQENERFLQGVTRGNAPIDRAMVQALQATIDKLRVLIGGLFRQDQPVTAVPAAPAVETQASETRMSEAVAPEPPMPVTSAPVVSVPVSETVPPPPAAATPILPPAMEQAVPQAHEGQAASVPHDRAAAERNWKTASVRVDIGRLDRLMQIAEDLLMPSLVSAERMRAARRLTEQLADLRGEMRRARFSPKSRHATDLPKEAEHAISGALAELEMQSRQLTVALTDDSKALRAVVDELLRETKRARMMPAATMFSAFPAMVKDLSHEVGKDVKLRLRETSVEIDRKVIELVKDPLIHLVRNAIDHGIEQPLEREAAGKPKRGKITISVRSIEGGWIVIEVKDDGRGMNIPALRDAVLRANLLSPAAIAALADEDVVNYIFSPGVSTKSVITSLSGLGLGLAIVREQIERVEGKVEIRSVPDQGTLFRLEIPASIVSYRGLLVSAGAQKMLWPAEAVERVIGVPRQDVLAAARNGILVYDGESFPFGDLGAVVFGQAPDRSRDSRALIPCVLARNGARNGILMVDEIHGEIEVLVKDLPPPLRRVRNISATGLLATGQLALILRPSDVLTMMLVDDSAIEPVVEKDETKPARILVVDDSITTRTMERNLFEASGYEVRVASDGLEAWNILQSDSVDLIVSDIDMPGLNGFDLTARIRASHRLMDIPVVLVTALETREDKERGIRVGANAYVLKSSFEQSNLLQIVGRLI